MTVSRDGLKFGAIVIALGLGIGACQSGGNGEGSISPAAAPNATAAGASAETAAIAVRANGEAFVQEGLTTKDGWAIQFDRVAVGVNDVTIYQTEPPFDAQTPGPLKALTTLPVSTEAVVDLKGAPLPLLGTVKGPTGRYNALSWTLAPTATGPDGGAASIALAGTASKDGRSVPFSIAVDRQRSFECGDYVGDERKGIATAEGGELEITLHFDHWFGDGNLPADDPLNEEALGFEPFVALAEGDRVALGSEALATGLSADQRTALDQVIDNLAHVGEGHCRLREVQP